MYSQILQRFLGYHEKRMEQRVRVSVIAPDSEKEAPKDQADTLKEQLDTPLASDVELEILKSVPNSLKNRAHPLVKKLKDYTDLVDWDEKARLVCHGKPVPGSNIIDLVNDELLYVNKKISSLQDGSYLHER